MGGAIANLIFLLHFLKNECLLITSVPDEPNKTDMRKIDKCN